MMPGTSSELPDDRYTSRENRMAATVHSKKFTTGHWRDNGKTSKEKVYTKFRNRTYDNITIPEIRWKASGLKRLVSNKGSILLSNKK